MEMPCVTYVFCLYYKDVTLESNYKILFTQCRLRVRLYEVTKKNVTNKKNWHKKKCETSLKELYELREGSRPLNGALRYNKMVVPVLRGSYL